MKKLKCKKIIDCQIKSKLLFGVIYIFNFYSRLKYLIADLKAMVILDLENEKNSYSSLHYRILVPVKIFEKHFAP